MSDETSLSDKPEFPHYENKLTFADLQSCFNNVRDDGPGRKGRPNFQRKSVALSHKKPVEKVYLASGYYYEVRN